MKRAWIKDKIIKVQTNEYFKWLSVSIKHAIAMFIWKVVHF